MSLRELFLIFIGGGLGSVVRFALGRWINGMHSQHFPWGTLVVNIIACLFLGVVVGLAGQRQLISASSRLFWAVGFCGGFSTFSTFSNETLILLQNGFTVSMMLYIGASLIFCVAATSGGIYVGEHL